MNSLPLRTSRTNVHNNCVYTYSTEQFR